MLGLHGLGDLAHLDGGRGRAANTNTPPPLPIEVCPERQLEEKKERPVKGTLGDGGSRRETRRYCVFGSYGGAMLRLMRCGAVRVRAEPPE